MGFPLTSQEQKALGLAGKYPGQSVTVPLQEPTRSMGRSSLAIDYGALDSSLLEASWNWVQLNPDPFSDLGLTVSAAPLEDGYRWLKIGGAPTQTEYRCSVAGQQPEVRFPPGGDQFVRIAERTPVSLLVDGGPALVVRIQGDELCVTPFGRIQVNRSKPLVLSIDSQKWIEAAQHDSWMHDELMARFSLNDVWESAVAVGLYTRLVDPPISTLAKKSAKLVGPSQDENLDASIHWARSLDGQQVEGLARLADAAASDLLAQITELDAVMSPSVEAWQHDFLQACHARDDLEAVCALLDYANPPATTSCTAAVDDAGDLLVAAIPFELAIDSERLRRVLYRDPFVWWARMAMGT
jgi:hypothetical protein